MSETFGTDVAKIVRRLDMGYKISRREFLILLSASTSLLAGCRGGNGSSQPPATNTQPTPGANACAGATQNETLEDVLIQFDGMVATDVMAIRIDSGRIIYAEQMPYESQPSDQIHEMPHSNTGGQQRWVYRDGAYIGALVGPNDETLYTFDQVVEDALDPAWLSNPASYALSSTDDPAYAQVVTPLAVHRKSKPRDMGNVSMEWQWVCPASHTIYLQLPQPLQSGASYELSFPCKGYPALSFRYDPSHTLSEAVHISQIGFRPDELAKLGYLSCWMGDGGGLSYTTGLSFQVIDETSGESVYTGGIELSKLATDATEDPYNRNYNLTDVFRLDFSSLERPGRYHLYVEGVGCSYPFEIGPAVWGEAFRTAARGFYHQRNGIALGPPYTDFTRPRGFHPDDGMLVYGSTAALLDTDAGLNARGLDTANTFTQLVDGKTSEIVSNAWGGYCDAGDWDRRIQHLEATRLILELVELFPAFTTEVQLNIPESGNGLPDLVNEALWNLDCYRRMQTPEGGIRGGIESAEHPRYGEGSWQEQLEVFTYAPDMWSSYIYAGVAARAAGVLANTRPDLTDQYRESALLAMAFAEDEYANHNYDPLPHLVVDARNLAAAELFRLTGDAQWHALFLQTTAFQDALANSLEWQSHDQRDAAFVYTRTEQPAVEGQVKSNARAAILRGADRSVELGQQTAFNWTKMEPWRTMWNVLAAPQITEILRAHSLTDDTKYLRAAVLGCQHGAGANPLNMCFTTGVGQSWPQHALWLDARVQGKLPPAGITVYGPIDPLGGNDVIEILRPFIYPAVEEWPTTEFYFDVFFFPASTEFTVMQTLGPNTYAWGYLAARPDR